MNTNAVTERMASAMAPDADTNVSDDARDPRAEMQRLVAELEALPSHAGWRFTYDYPGYFCFGHEGSDYLVMCTPDWEEDETLPIQVQDVHGLYYDEHSLTIPLPFANRTGQQILDLVKPTLDAVQVLSVARVAALTEPEVEALKLAREVVRVHMTHDHSFEVRDCAMAAIAKVITASKKVS